MTTYKNGLHKLLNDDYFWHRYKRVAQENRVKTLKDNRISGYIPQRRTLDCFVEDYVFITKDSRPIEDIKLELVSKVE